MEIWGIDSNDETFIKYRDIVNEMWSDEEIGEYGEEI